MSFLTEVVVMADSCGIYAEDIVKNSQGNVGLVLQDAEETSEDESEDEFLKKGQILVCWYPSGNEETLSLSKVKLADRSLLPGDVVKFADANKGTQKGFISNVEVIASIKILVANQVLHNINCKRLDPLQELVPSVHVSMGPWLGLITEVYQKVVLRLKNGARCCLEGDQCSMLYDLSDQRDEDSPFYSEAFYPGQKVAAPAKAFKDVKWLSGLKPILHNQAQIKGTIEEAIVTACDVDWQVCGACHHSNESLVPPEATITQNQLQRLNVVNHFRHASLQIGDKAFYVLEPGDVASALKRGGSAKSHDTCASQDNAMELDEPSDGTEHACNAAPSETEHACNAAPWDNLTRDGEWKSETTNLECTEMVGMINGVVKGEEREAEKKNDGISLVVAVSSDGSLDCNAPGSESKQHRLSSAGSVSDSHLSASEEGSRKECDGKENDCRSVRSETNHVDVHNDHDQAAGSDSGDADEDSDCVETVIPKVRGASVGSLKYDSGSSHAVRFPTKRRKKRLRRKRKAAPPLKVNAGDKVCVEVANTSTTVDVIWQDGSKQSSILSTELIPVFHLDELEFFPGDYVCDKRENADSSLYGAVLTTDHKSRLCHVKWFSREGHELFVERDVSVYDITEHADFVFSAGDVVVRVASCKSDVESGAEGQDAQKPLPCVGQVTIVDEEGFVFIRWVNNTVSRVKPQELYKVDAEDDDHLSSNGSTGGSDDEWETASAESSDEELSTEIIENSSPRAENSSPCAENSSPCAENSSPRAENTTGDEAAENVDREALHQRAHNRLNEIMSNSNPPFMMLETVPDGHAYKNTTFQPENQRRFLSCVRREMALLQTSLPTGIIVRGCEDRMDLMRVMITGPADTPYEHGLFIFDVRLPSDYPASPPVFHYLSQCSGRLNPNLYEDGKVCVSLLGTWAGKGSEMWTSKSNVLQVLVSIQGLILCNEPYFNEAGYEKQRGTVEGLENSRLYNEMVLLKLVQSMERLVTRPPAGLENEILQHFTHYGAKMAQKFKMWIDHHPDRSETVTAGCYGEKSGDSHGTVPSMKENQRQDEQPSTNSVHHNTGLVSAESDTPVDRLSLTKTNGELSSKQKASATNKPGSVLARDTPELAERHSACQDAETAAQTNPDFPLFPVSRGFCLSLRRNLNSLNAALGKAHLAEFSKKP